MLDWYYDQHPLVRVVVALVLLGLSAAIFVGAFDSGGGRRAIGAAAVLGGLGLGALLLAIPSAADRKQKEWGDW